MEMHEARMTEFLHLSDQDLIKSLEFEQDMASIDAGVHKQVEKHVSR